MNSPKGVARKDDLAFFGRISASISHEIKNCLAVINEQNGLHQDFLMLQQQGQSVDPKRIERINRIISEQVQRMDTIVKRLNRFSHSLDNPEESIDLGELCDYVVHLCERFATNKGVVLTREMDSPAAITGQPFLITRLIVECLEAIFAEATSGQAIVLRAQNSPQGSLVAITPGLKQASDELASLAARAGVTLQQEGKDKIAVCCFQSV